MLFARVLAVLFALMLPAQAAAYLTPVDRATSLGSESFPDRQFNLGTPSTGDFVFWMPSRHVQCTTDLMLPTVGCAPVSINFTMGRGRNGYQVLPAASLISVARLSPETCADTAGNYYQVGNNVGCITNQGLGVWESRTNSIRNNSMVGAVAGSPGTLPTNWVSGNIQGLTVNVIGVGLESGVNYIDLQYTGTPSGTGVATVFVEQNNQIAATYGQTWSFNGFVRQSGGSATNVTGVSAVISERNSGGGQTQGNISSNLTYTNSTLGTSRFSFQKTLGNASTAFLNASVALGVTSGQAVNITLRIGWPQLENNSLINSSVASATVQAEVQAGRRERRFIRSVAARVRTTPTLNVTVVGGAVTSPTVNNAGSCTVFPPSPAALTYVSGTGSGVTGATVNLTPDQQRRARLSHAAHRHVGFCEDAGGGCGDACRSAKFCSA